MRKGRQSRSTLRSSRRGWTFTDSLPGPQSEEVRVAFPQQRVCVRVRERERIHLDLENVISQTAVGLYRWARMEITLFGDEVPAGSDGHESACSAGDAGSVPPSGRSLEKGMAVLPIVPAWRAPWTEGPGGPHGVANNRTRLSNTNSC